MAQNSRYVFQGSVSERKVREFLGVLARYTTPDRAAFLTGLNPKRRCRCPTLLKGIEASLAPARSLMVTLNFEQISEVKIGMPVNLNRQPRTHR